MKLSSLLFLHQRHRVYNRQTAEKRREKRKREVEDRTEKKRKMEQRKVLEATTWESLPISMLEQIGKYLTSYSDYLRFRCVCKSWMELPEVIRHFPFQFPWLLMPPSHNIGELSRRVVFDFSQRRTTTFGLDIPAASRTSRPCGSSHGWVIYCYDTAEIVLFNPLSKVRFELPSICRFPNVSSYDPEDPSYLVTPVLQREYGYIGYPSNRVGARKMRNWFIRKVVLSSSPEDEDGFIAMALVSSSGGFVLNHLAYYDRICEAWVFLDDEPNDWTDLTFHKGKCYVLESSGRLGVCEFYLNFPSSFERIQMVAQFRNLTAFGDCFKVPYLVSSGDELLLVRRLVAYEIDSRQATKPILSLITKRCLVYKLIDYSWEELYSLGDRVLFVGVGDSLSATASNWSNCSPNTIYFSDMRENIGDSLGSPDLVGPYKIRRRNKKVLPI